MPTSVLRLGDQGPGVTEVRERLAQLGFLPADTEVGIDVFDASVESALRVFQQSRGLTVDGIAGPQSLRRLEEARWTIGDRVLTYAPSHLLHGEDIAQLQQRLLELGFALDRVDGVFGKNTDKAVREFQLNVGLEVDGIAGPEVFQALARLARTVSGGNQEHLRELAGVESVQRWQTLDSAVVFVDPSSSTRTFANSELSEAQVCRDIANRVEGRLLTTGAQVIIAKSLTDSNSDERERAQMANGLKVDLVISLRCDEANTDGPHGVATYYFGHEYSRSATGMRLAELIQEEITRASELLDCRSHPKTWDLLRLTRMPAVRIELGYLSSAVDRSILADEGARDSIAQAITSAVARLLAPRIG